MKKVLCLFLAVIMLAGLCGCFGGNGTDDVRGEIVSGNNSQADDGSEDIADENSSQADDGSQDAVSENSSEDESESEFSLGEASNNTYHNDFLGISCTLPAEWMFYSDEQILELNNMVGTVVDEEIAEQLENANIIYDMYAINETDGSSININLEKLSTVQMVGLDMKQTLEAQIDAIKSSYQNMGYTDTNVEYQKITVDGKEFDGLSLSAKIQGADFYGCMFTFKKSNYLANVTIGSFQPDETDTVLSYFTVE